MTKKLNDLNQKLSLLDRYHESLIENIAMFKDDKKKRLKIGINSPKSIIYNMISKDLFLVFFSLHLNKLWFPFSEAHYLSSQILVQSLG